MRKQVIRITESDIRNMVNESVRRVLIENGEDEGFLSNVGNGIKGAVQGLYRSGQNVVNTTKANVLQGVVDGQANQKAKLENGIKTLYNSISETLGNGWENNFNSQKLKDVYNNVKNYEKYVNELEQINNSNYAEKLQNTRGKLKQNYSKGYGFNPAQQAGLAK